MKVGTWKEKPKNHKSLNRDQSRYLVQGFILLETLICLAVLALFLPFGYRIFMNGVKKYQDVSFLREAAVIAKEEMMIAELELFQNVQWPQETEKKMQMQGWVIHRMITHEEENLKNVRITIKNRKRDSHSEYVIEQWILKR